MADGLGWVDRVNIDGLLCPKIEKLRFFRVTGKKLPFRGRAQALRPGLNLFNRLKVRPEGLKHRNRGSCRIIPDYIDIVGRSIKVA